jgi:putative addiction module component (TIGR02574 family)
MNSKRQEILDSASALPEEDREWIVEMLSLTLAGRNLAEVDAAWEKEIARRVKEIDDGTAELIPWEEVRDSILKRAPGVRK